MSEYKCCGTCKFIDTDAEEPPCESCRYNSLFGGEDNWQPAEPPRTIDEHLATCEQCWKAESEAK